MSFLLIPSLCTYNAKQILFFSSETVSPFALDKKVTTDELGQPFFVNPSTGLRHTLPDFLIIGEQKCGTGKNVATMSVQKISVLTCFIWVKIVGSSYRAQTIAADLPSLQISIVPISVRLWFHDYIFWNPAGALRDFLEHHLDLSGAKTRESQYFTFLYRQEPLSWYLKRMATSSPGKLSFEKTAGYLRREGVAKRIKQIMPDAKFIVIVLDPVTRCRLKLSILSTILERI